MNYLGMLKENSIFHLLYILFFLIIVDDRQAYWKS